jgi:DNA polymerase III subunit epsilon
MGANDEALGRMRDAAIRWAQQLLRSDDWVVLDTETTGLDTKTAEIVEIAVIDKTGKALFDKRVKPRMPISPDATRVHGITDEDVASTPALDEIWPQIMSVLSGKRVIIFNAAYDSDILRCSADRHKLLLMPFKPACALNMYRSFRALDNRGVSRGNSLEEACRRHGIKAGGHSAVGDCQATLALLGVMAQLEVAHVKAPVEPDVVEVNAIPGDSRRVEVWDTRSDSALADVSDEVGMAPWACPHDR